VVEAGSHANNMFGDFGRNFCTAASNSTGGAAHLRAFGTPGNFSAVALQAISTPNSVGMFFLGSVETSTPFGNGNICLTGSIQRLQVVTASNNNAWGFADLSSAAPARLQYWFRDPAAGGAQFNFSAGLRIS
jgi:hypothetical protein